jgi:hypothetical protein
MTTKFLVLVTIVTGCATTERMSSWSGPEHRTGTGTLDIRPGHADPDEAQAWFPTLASEPALPTADRMRDQLLATGRDRFDVGVRICVTPDGSVSRVDLTQTSGEQLLDNMAVHDIKAWRYESFAGPAGVHTCEPLSIRYIP